MSTQKTPQAMYEELVAAIVKAVPVIKKHPAFKGEYEECIVCGVIRESAFLRECSRPITLEDVLLAEIETIDKEHHPTNPSVRDQLYKQWTLKTLAEWSLGKPLSEQSPETISFLHSLLKP